MKTMRCCLLVWMLLWTFANVGWAQWPLGKEAPSAAKDQEYGGHVTGSGRFQIFVSPQAKGFTFMLDSDNGRVWILKKDHSSGEFSFQRVPVQDVKAEKTSTETPPGKEEKGK